MGDGGPGHLLVSAKYTFESESRAAELGVEVDSLTQPRSGHQHRFLELASSVGVPGEDWRVRQDELDRLLDAVVAEAKLRSISLPADGAQLSLRISFIGDPGEQLGYALTSEFLGTWASLGGDLYVDS